MTRRSRARAVALQVLFQDDLNPGHNPGEADQFLAPFEGRRIAELARSLVAGVRRNRTELDALLSRTAENWGLDRMAATDRNVLRLGAFEVALHGNTGPGRDQRSDRLGQTLRLSPLVAVRQRHSR
ncbi:MAG: transcription antitermination factor NusB [Pirellulales bacterium]